MTKNTIIRSAIISVLISLCVLGFFIVSNNMLGMSIPSYLIILILILTNTLTFQYFLRKSKNSKSKK